MAIFSKISNRPTADMPAFDADATAERNPLRSQNNQSAQPHAVPPVPPPDTSASRAYSPPAQFAQIVETVQNYLVTEIKTADLNDTTNLRSRVEPVFDEAIAEAGLVISRAERRHLLDLLLADTVGFGPLQPLLEREDITEIMVNGPK
ncbi:MAG: hypothetical protein J5I90_12770, partial [Caldilineales bacterium]|nr:hypothetical protein [Caldilineales bacterium]